jgi:hypothetical protein
MACDDDPATLAARSPRIGDVAVSFALPATRCGEEFGYCPTEVAAMAMIDDTANILEEEILPAERREADLTAFADSSLASTIRPMICKFRHGESFGENRPISQSPKPSDAHACRTPRHTQRRDRRWRADHVADRESHNR